MSSDPFAFNYETAKDLVRLVKRTKNGEFAAELDTSLPVQKANFVWAYVPSSITGTYDTTIKAWKLNGAIKMFPVNLGKDSSGHVQWGTVDDAGVITGGITCTIWVPYQDGTTTAPTVGAGYYLGMVFDTDNTTGDPMVMIAKPPAAGSGGGGSGGSAVIDVVTDVVCTPNGLEVSTVTLSGADYNNAVIRNFTALSDVTQKSYTGNQGRAVVVNAAQTGLEFGPVIGEMADTFISLSDTPQGYGTTNTYKVLTVSSTNAGVSFSDNNITTQNSITGGGNPNNPLEWEVLQLINDVEEPTGHSFYGCNVDSVKGWRRITLTVLTDFPSSYSGSAGKLLKVKGDQSGVEFATNAFTTLTDCPSAYTGAAGKLIRVNSTQTGLEFYALDLTALQADITQLKSDVSAAQSSITSIQGDITSIQADLQTVTTGLTQAQTDIATLQSDVLQNSANIQDILSRLATAESNIQSLQTDLANAQGDIASNYSSLDARLTALGG
jgi:hypothetical protein